MANIIQAEIVIDDEYRQVAIFFIRDDLAVLEKHYRKLSNDVFCLFVDTVHKYLAEIDSIDIERRGNRFIVYDGFEYVISLAKSLDRKILGE